MPDWRDAVLTHLPLGIHRLLLVADPDRLLLNERILTVIQQHDYQLLPYDDPIIFRYEYESRYRRHWDRGENLDTGLIVRVPVHDLNVLPYDLLQIGRPITISLGEIFPNLSYPIISQLDADSLDTLYKAYQRRQPRPLGDTATKAFILAHVFDLDPDAIDGPEDLLHTLLRRHYQRLPLPPVLEEELIRRLRRKDQFAHWPLDILIQDREAFLDFLQERWPIFLERFVLGDSEAFHESLAAHPLQYPGPDWLPLDDKRIRVFIDTLFVEGALHPIPFSHAQQLADSWISIGIETSPKAHRLARLNKLLPAVTKGIPDANAPYRQWFQFAYRWAELTTLILSAGADLPTDIRQAYDDLMPQVDAAILTWAQQRYQTLIHLPPSPPVMLHHIPRYLTRLLEDDDRARIAFLLLDGLSLDQWLVLRDILQSGDDRWRFREEAIFAWLPTITPVSRQTAFAGAPPVYFRESIDTTAKEEKLWRAFWERQGLNSRQVAYLKGLGDPSDLEHVKESLSSPKLRVIGLVINKVDDIMHGMELGVAGMHNQVRQWAETGFLTALLEQLHAGGFQVFLTSDHGNIEAKGIGRPREGVTADVRGARVRIYNDEGLRARVHREFPESIPWPPIGLPDDYLPLLAPPRAAFALEGKTIVGHGGLSVEELIVPFIHILAKSL